MKTWMKFFTLLLVSLVVGLSAHSIGATTPNTIITDGSMVDWQPDEYLGPDANSGVANLGVTWDASDLYIAIDNWPFDVAGDLHVYLDTSPGGEPQSVNWGGTMNIATQGGGWEYAWIAEDGGYQAWYTSTGGGGWAGPTSPPPGSSYVGWGGTPVTEIAIPFSDIGIVAGGRVTVLVLIVPEDNSAWAQTWWPSDPTNTPVSFGRGFVFYGVGLPGISPNSAPNAVTLTSFTAEERFFPALLAGAVIALGGMLVWRRKRG